MQRVWGGTQCEGDTLGGTRLYRVLLPPACIPVFTRPRPRPHAAQYDLSEDSAVAAMDEVLEDPDFLDAVAEEVRGGGKGRKGWGERQSYDVSGGKEGEGREDGRAMNMGVL